MRLKQTIENNLYGYDANEFTPVWRDNRLDNRAEFALYKAEQFADVLGHLASRTVTATIAAGSILLEHVAQEVE
jgi:hypothetical protein